MYTALFIRESSFWLDGHRVSLEMRWGVVASVVVAVGGDITCGIRIFHVLCAISDDSLEGSCILVEPFFIVIQHSTWFAANEITMNLNLN